jgi:hypothetical protein
MKMIEKKTKENIKQLFYDLYNNHMNEKASVDKFEILFDKYYNIAEIHYDILIKYLDNKDKINRELYLLEKLSNEIQDFVCDNIFI